MVIHHNIGQFFIIFASFKINSMSAVINERLIHYGCLSLVHTYVFEHGVCVTSFR